MGGGDMNFVNLKSMDEGAPCGALARQEFEVDAQPVITEATRSDPWTQAEAIELCRQIEAVCPQFGCHVALTGGALYKDGPRKDLDILFYRIRQVPMINVEGLFAALKAIGIEQGPDFGWCKKATFHNKQIDCFFPEEANGDYDAG